LDGYFCGSPNVRELIYPGQRCVHTAVHLLTRVSSHESAPDTSDVMCALGKQASDGSGANVTRSSCVQTYYPVNSDSYCTTGYSCQGYATIIHQHGVVRDTFYGHLWAVW
jgi:hypothetical protein